MNLKNHFWVAASCLSISLVDMLLSNLLNHELPIYPIVGVITAAIIVYGLKAFPAILLANISAQLIAQSLSFAPEATSLMHLLAVNGIYLLHMLTVLAMSKLFSNAKTLSLSKMSDCIKTFVWSLLLPCVILPSLQPTLAMLDGNEVSYSLSAWLVYYFQGLIGSMISLPIALLAFSQGIQSWQRIKYFALPISLLIVATLYLFQFTLSIENNQLHKIVAEKTTDIESAIQQRIQSYKRSLKSLAIYFEVQPNMGPKEFEAFTIQTLNEDPDIFGLSHNPIITEHTRQTWETNINASYNRNDIFIKERGADGLIPSPVQDYYVPVGFIEPLEKNKTAIGFNIYSNRERRTAILHALSKKEVAITAPIKLVQENQQRMGALAMEPIFDTDKRITGLAVAVLKIDDIINHLLNREIKNNFLISINDSDPAYSELTLFKNPISAELDSKFKHVTHLQIFNRDWRVELTPTQAFINSNKNNFVVTTTLLGFLIVAIIEFILMNASSVQQQIKSEIEEKTLLLNTQNNVLKANMATLEEISNEKEHLLETTQNTLHELQDRREKQEKLFAIIGHELRTPIAMLKMMLSEQRVSILAPYGQKIVDTTEHALNVLDDMRAIVNPQKYIQKIEPCNPKQDLADTLTGLKYLLEERHIEATLIADELADQSYAFDRYSFKRLTLNLIKNSVMHSQGKHIWVTINACQPGEDNGCFDIFFDDDGKGIDDIHLPHLFSEFYRGDTQADGSGLGLAICKSIVDSLHGDIEYQKSPQGGARFAVRLNFKNPIEEPQSAPSISNNDTIMLDGANVLVAEDQLVIRTITEKWLKQHGANVVTAEDGQHALDAFDKQPFDLVITDIMMPNIDGYELTEILRAKGYKGLIIGATAATVGEEIQKLMDVGADASIPKPLDIHVLNKTLKSLKAS